MTLIVGPSAEATPHNFCESCYPSVETECLATYGSQPNSTLPSDVEHISALEYLEASAKATRNGADKPAFKHIEKELSRLPMARQRLAFEMLSLASQSLDRGEEPGWAAGFAGCCWGLIEPHRKSEYATCLEKIIERCFELRRQLPASPGDHGAFGMTLTLMLIALGKVDRHRFEAILQTLRSRGGDSNLDPRWKVIDQAEKRILR
jgi:hypothetical protein